MSVVKPRLRLQATTLPRLFPATSPDLGRGLRHRVKSLIIIPALVSAMCAPVHIVIAPVARASGIAGMSVFLDPGHSGINDSSITRQVPNGRGGTKDCQTTGTSTNNGYSEHSFNWDVAVRVRAALEQLGVRTQMSRADDDSVAPCVDQRAAAANAMHPDADVSIHADGGPASGHGFHVNYSAPPLNEAQSGPAIQLATVMRDAMVAAGLQPSTYVGSNGLYGRADLAGLNLAEYPAILVETGNMRNADEAAQMETPDGRQRYADVITQGIVTYLTQKAGGA
jgi:N-acetylmuramoyl-L-alanine amidase